jgi:DNA repair exonuclease SbcCD ATPase subunit
MNEKERNILAALSKHLGAEDVVSPTIYVSDEEKRLKEERLSKKWAKFLGEPEPEPPTEQNIREEKILESLTRHLEATTNKIEELEVPEPIVEIEQQVDPVIEETETIEEKTFVDAALDNAKTVTQPVFTPVEKQPELPEKDFITKSVEKLSKTTRKVDSTLDSNDPIRNEINQLKRSVLDLHHFASRISQMGGGGAGDVNSLDHATKLVTSDYTASNKDYYVGVNSPNPCTITLPPNKKNGRLFILKDESGNCATNRITIIASNGDTIDNDTSAIMGINNMTLQFIYRNGWRII